MKNKHFFHYQFLATVPLLVGYLLMLVLLWLLSTLYYLPKSFLLDVVRFSLPVLLIWEVINSYQAIRRVKTFQKDQLIAAHNPVEHQLLSSYESQKQAHEQALRHLNNQQQHQFDHVELYSHEIKNSLTSLQAAAENSSTVPSQTVLESVHQANDHLNMLLSDERLAMTNHDFNFEWVGLDGLVNDILKQNSAVFINHQLIPQLKDLADVQVLTDRKWLRFCIYQLLSNAIKYSSNGSRIIIQWHSDSLEVVDFGEGISASDLPRIYENGFSGQNGHETTKATGMGLYLVQKVAHQLNFDLNVDSKLKQGTTARLLFARENVRSTASNQQPSLG